VPMPSFFVSPQGPVSVPTVTVPSVLSSWPEAWLEAWAGEWAQLASPGAGTPVSAPVPGVPASTGWPLDLAAAPLSGAVPVALNLPGAGVPFAHGPLPGSAPPRRRHPASGDRRRHAGRPHPGTRTRSDARGPRSVPAVLWSGRVVRPAPRAAATLAAATLTRAPSPPRLRDDGAGPPGRARPAGAPSSPVPPLSAPATGGGAAAAAGGSGGGGGGSLALVTIAALLLSFTLSTRVSLDLSAWRSTLLGLRLERPG
jgi:hypothetical protein